MKTSLLAPAPASHTVKADRPQHLKSVTVYFGGRKMVLMQRPQRRLSLLLCRMLRRSMLNLLGRLPVTLAAPVKKVLSAGALCAMALASVTTAHATATVDTLPVNTLPTNPAVVYGTAGVSTTGNQMNVGIGTNKAIINWGSFSIGSQAGVDFHFDSATSTSSVLNRVIGNDPSKIMGSLTSNGKVFLINSAGILVGKTAKIDVAGFAASTLNMSNSDFLAGKMHFYDQHRHHRAAGDVVVEEDGAIKTKDGGSVYLIGSNVENGGVITSPGGEVLLAAGHSVDLVDTGTPGVKINVKGDKGKVTNLGQIIAATGTIGFGAALINNSGVINASSVDKQGGRIFLRASKDLTTTATSSINADGATGGNVVLYADGTSIIDGDLSAVGNVDGKGGAGGYIDTSGKKALAVHYLPRVGKGGEWFIDPADVDIVTAYSQQSALEQLLEWLGIISFTGTHTEILASTINTSLNTGANVTISTGLDNSNGNDAGNIAVLANIAKSDANSPATLTLNAKNNITIADNVSISDSGTAGHGLGLVMNAGYSDSTGSVVHNNAGQISASNATISVTNGFEAHASHYQMTGGSLSSSGNFVMDAPLAASIGADITVNNAAGTATFGTVSLANSSLTLSGGTASLGATDLDTTSSLTVQNASQTTMSGDLTGTGTLNLGANNADTVALNAGTHAVTVKTLHQKSGSLNGNTSTGGTLTVNGSVDQTGGTINFHDVSLTQSSGTLSVGNVTATNTLSLQASSGDITQKASSHLTAAVLSATATGGISLTNATNAVAALAATNTSSGNIAYSGTGNLNLNAISNGNRDVTLTTSDGAITQSGAMTAGHVTASAATGINLSNSSNNIVEFSASNTGSGDVTVKSYGNQAFKIDDVGTVSGNISISNDHNQVALYGNLTTASTAGNSVTLISGSGVVQNGGNITANHLDAQTNADIDFGSTGNDVRNFTASSGNGHISLTDMGALATGNVIAGVGKYITLTTAGNLTTSGQINGGAISLTSTGGDIALNGGVRSSGTAIINAHGAITQTADVAAASLNAMAGTGITLNNTANSVAGFSANNSVSGDISFTNNHGGLLTLGTVNNGARNVTINTDSNMLQDGSGVTAGKLDVTAYGGINLNSANNHVSTFVATNPLGNINIIDNGDLTLGVISGPSGTVNVTVNGGKVTQSGAMTAGTANVSATAGITLDNTGNNIGAFTASNTASGDVALVDSVASLSMNGTISNTATGGNVSIVNTGDIIGVATHSMQDGSVTNGTFADGKVTLTAKAGNGSAGNVKLAQVTTKDLEVNADGAITQEGTNAVVLNVTGTMTAVAKTGITLDGNSNVTFLNHIANFNANNTVSGDIKLVAGGDLTVQDVTNTNGEIHLKTQGTLTVDSGKTVSGQMMELESYGETGLIINGQLTATGATGVSLTTDGDINQTAGSGINAQLLVANGQRDISLTGADNQFSQLQTGTFSGNITASSSGNFTVGLQNYGGTTDITSTDGNITLHNVGASDLTLHADHGSIAQAMFYDLNAETLNASARDGINLNVTCSTASVGTFSATNTGSGDITLNNLNSDGVTVQLGTINNANGNVTISSFGAVQTTGPITASNTNGKVSLTAIGRSEHGGLTIGGTIAAKDIDLKTVISSTESVNTDIQVNGALTAAGAVTLTSDDGEIWQNAGISANSLTATAAHGISLNSESNHVGTFAATNAHGVVNFTNSGNLTLGVIDGSDSTVNVTVNNGKVTQSGAMTAGTANVSATAGITLDNTGNNIATFEATNTGSGDVALTNRSGQALMLGAIDNGVRNVMIDTNSTLSQSDGVTAGTLNVKANGGVTLNSASNLIGTFVADSSVGGISITDSDDLALGVINGGSSTVNVTVNNGKVTQIGAMTAGTANVSATAGITLDNTGNNIATFEATNTGSGDVALTNRSGQALMLGAIDNGTRNVTIDNTGGNVVQNDGVTAGKLNVSASGGIDLESQNNYIGAFAATNTVGDINLADNGNVILGTINGAPDGAFNVTVDGKITEDGTISVGSLTAIAANGITLDNAGNSVSELTALNSGSGGITFKNTSTGTAGKTLTTNAIATVGGDIWIENTGEMDVNGAVNAPNGAVNLITHSPLTINGPVNAGGNINFSAGSTTNASNADNIVVNGVVTSVAGAVAMIAGNGVTLNALVHGPAGFDVTSHTYVSSVQQPVSPHITVTAGPLAVTQQPPAPSAPVPVVGTNTTVDQNIASTSNNINNMSDTATPMTTPTNTSTSASNQTVGGGDGEFGGDKDDGKAKNDKNAKAPMCT